MGLSDLTENAIRQAINEFDQLGREAFLKKYGFRGSRGYFLLHQRQRYDSKAIAGAAHGYSGYGLRPLEPSEFSGGEKTVVKRLRELGFTVQEPGVGLPKVVPFVQGRLYHRLRDIHEVYRGQERGGIATPSHVPYVFLFSGESGNQYGYRDGWRADGVFAYSGEGQIGDMKFVHGNRAVRDHVPDGKDLLLFEASKPKGMYRFLGCFACAGWEHVDTVDREGNKRKSIVFQLIPTSEVDESEEADLAPANASVAELRRLAHSAQSPSPVPAKEARRSYYHRSAVIKAYVLARAAGYCEACGRKAPFVRKDGTPYLEPHHTERVADGGPDHPKWVGAVCPTCHREIHHGERGDELNRALKVRLEALESDPLTSVELLYVS